MGICGGKRWGVQCAGECRSLQTPSPTLSLMLPDATCSDGAAHRAEAWRIPLHSSLAVARQRVCSECLFPASRGGDPHDGSSHIHAESVVDADHSAQSRGPGSLAGNFQSIARPAHSARAPARSCVSAPTRPPSGTLSRWRRTSCPDPRSRTDIDRAPERPPAVAVRSTPLWDAALHCSGESCAFHARSRKSNTARGTSRWAP